MVAQVLMLNSDVLGTILRSGKMKGFLYNSYYNYEVISIQTDFFCVAWPFAEQWDSLSIFLHSILPSTKIKCCWFLLIRLLYMLEYTQFYDNNFGHFYQIVFSMKFHNVLNQNWQGYKNAKVQHCIICLRLELCRLTLTIIGKYR